LKWLTVLTVFGSESGTVAPFFGQLSRKLTR
jgi:hypothetical protein